MIHYILSGFGFAIGFALFVGVILTSMILLLKKIKKSTTATKFTKALFSTYLKTLVDAEKYEEAISIRDILSVYQDGKTPSSEQLKLYTVKTKTTLDVNADSNKFSLDTKQWIEKVTS